MVLIQISHNLKVFLFGDGNWISNNAFTIVDGSGVDTVDFSGFMSDQLIDLEKPTSILITYIHLILEVKLEI